MNDNNALRELFGELSAAPRFTERAVNIPGDFRTSWRLSVLCLLVSRGRARTLTLDHLHVLWWAVRSSVTRDLLMRWFAGERRPDEMLIRFDPSLTITLDLALGHGLVDRTKTGGIHLTTRGAELVAAVQGEESVLVEERAFLAALPKSINQTQVRDLLEWK